MEWYKMTKDDEIVSVGISSVKPIEAVEINKAKYEELCEKLNCRPFNTLENVYFLSNTTEDWVSRKSTDEEKNNWWFGFYFSEVTNGKMIIEDVPEEYREEVSAVINTPDDEPEPTYTLDEAAAIIASEVAGNE